MRFKLDTGRTHQIRVHCAHIGHPIVGDATYSRCRKLPIPLSGQALHAVALGLDHRSRANGCSSRRPCRRCSRACWRCCAGGWPRGCAAELGHGAPAGRDPLGAGSGQWMRWPTAAASGAGPSPGARAPGLAAAGRRPPGCG
jgi:hypothetical protein